MKCTGKEWDTCRVEKMGCKGCYYDNTEIESNIKNLKEIVSLCEEEIKTNNGNISAVLDLKDLKSLKSVLNYIQQLEKKIKVSEEKDFKKKEYLNNNIQNLKQQMKGTKGQDRYSYKQEIQIYEKFLELYEEV